MKFPTELKIIVDKNETLFERYINCYLAGDKKNIIIKEDYIMLEELKAQREEYLAEVERLKELSLDEIVNARFELIKEKIAEEVKAEHEEKLAKANLNVEHYDFVIARLEEKALEEVNENIVEE